MDPRRPVSNIVLFSIIDFLKRDTIKNKNLANNPLWKLIKTKLNFNTIVHKVSMYKCIELKFENSEYNIPMQVLTDHDAL